MIPDPEKKQLNIVFRFKKLLKSFGPGFITGAADDDPSGIGTYSQTGAIFGYTQLWTALFTFPLQAAIQEMCGRVGMVTGLGLSGVIKKHYVKPVLYFSVLLLFIANTVNIGADLGAMAAASQLLFGIPYWLLLLSITSVTLILEIVVPYPAYAKFLKFLALSLFAYIITMFLVKADWGLILTSTLIPTISFTREYLFNIVAILGTTISPYLFFWQSDEEVEEEIEHHKLRGLGRGVPRISWADISSMRTDTIVGMFFSNLVMFFIIAAVASTLNVAGITSIETADQAAQALRPIAGDFSYILFAAGIIGTGLLAVPILAGSAAYAVSEAFGWRAGLNKTFKQAHAFYGVIALATIIGLAVNFTEIKPFQMLYYTAILNGLCAPPLMILIMFISNNQNIMGKYTNKLASNLLGWIVTIVMTLCALALIWSLF